MPIETICQGCARKLRVDDQYAGKQARCPHCRRVYTVPSQRAAATEATEDQLWFVRAADGLEYGPVAFPELEQWVKEGRVTADARLQRKDEVHWQPASEVFPALHAPAEDGQNPFAEHAVTRVTENPYQASAVVSHPVLTPHRGGTVLMLGILGLLCCPFAAPFAWVIGYLDLNKIRAGQMDATGSGTTQAGMVLGIVLMFFWIAFQVLMIAVSVVD